jgi:hypothetical protein
LFNQQIQQNHQLAALVPKPPPVAIMHLPLELNHASIKLPPPSTQKSDSQMQYKYYQEVLQMLKCIEDKIEHAMHVLDKKLVKCSTTIKLSPP